ncbi:MAG: response regulator transcription factor [Crocinitomicaceae bacterium]|nr:response regulator transcription factor [Crocinitomicaceae bacterium]
MNPDYKYKILVVDDEEDIRTILEFNLKKEGYIVKTVENGVEALKKLKTFVPDLVILDVMMPEMDGIEVCREIRQSNDFKNLIVTFLTARTEDYSQIAGFDAGADAYIEKPIRPRLLLSRVKALLRRKDLNPTNKKQSIQVDREKYMVFQNDQEVVLPKKEFELLSLLISRPGIVFTREMIFDEVWGNETIVGDRTIDVHIRKLREKIGDNSIKTVKGVGYKFEEI